MTNLLQFFIDGAWRDPLDGQMCPIVNPATEQPIYSVALGSKRDVDAAVAAARRAFDTYSLDPAERVALLERLIEAYQGRATDLARAISDEMGAPLSFAEQFQVKAGLAHIVATRDAMKAYKFEEKFGSVLVRREAIGVVGMITPWNWPLNQIVAKVAPALAAGCTMVLKPSELTPSSGAIFAEIVDQIGVPPGVFNLIHGLGPEVGSALAEHPDVDMISFTGSTRAGVDVALRAAPTVKRVGQELGGKSPNIILENANFEEAVAGGAKFLFNNAGQSCAAPSRMLVPLSRMDEAAAIAKRVADDIRVGDPRGADTQMGPVISETQWNKIQSYIRSGIDEGATLAAGGPGRPVGIDRGFFVKPTVFSQVTNDMRIAREEIFGPVLVVIGYRDTAEAISIANDTPYGLSGYVSGGTPDEALDVARRIRAGTINLNGAMFDRTAPFGGYKQSGNGREWGKFGMEDFLEVKAIAGAA